MSVAPKALAVAIAALVPLAAGARCQVASAGACAIELHGEGAPRAAASCGSEAWAGHLGFDLPEGFADADGNGWYETVVRIDVHPERGCGCAVFRVVYDGEPEGYTVNIGDSPSNNGHGGDDWSTRFDAELMILRGVLSVFASERVGARAAPQVFGLEGLPLAGGVLELEICDQSVRYSVEPAAGEAPIDGFFSAPRSRDLISIARGGRAGDAPAETDATIHAAFNRVIHRRAGRPYRQRFGAGVRRVEITLTP